MKNTQAAWGWWISKMRAASWSVRLWHSSRRKAAGVLILSKQWWQFGGLKRTENLLEWVPLLGQRLWAETFRKSSLKKKVKICVYVTLLSRSYVSKPDWQRGLNYMNIVFGCCCQIWDREGKVTISISPIITQWLGANPYRPRWCLFPMTVGLAGMLQPHYRGFKTLLSGPSKCQPSVLDTNSLYRLCYIVNRWLWLFCFVPIQVERKMSPWTSKHLSHRLFL